MSSKVQYLYSARIETHEGFYNVTTLGVDASDAIKNLRKSIGRKDLKVAIMRRLAKTVTHEESKKIKSVCNDIQGNTSLCSREK